MSDGPATIELTPVETIPAPTHVLPAPQRLRLHHLFVMTAVLAVLLFANRPAESPGFTMPPAVKLVFEAVVVCSDIINAIAITAILQGLVWRRRGYMFFHEPGHWIMVSMTISALVGLATVFVQSLLLPSDFSKPEQLNYVAIFASTLIFPAITIGMVLMNVYIGMKKCAERQWQQVFYAKAGEIVPLFGTLAVLWLLDRAVRADRPQRGGVKQPTRYADFVPPIVAPIHPGHPRDPAHRCGVVLQYITCGMTVLMFFGMVAWLSVHFMS